MASVLTKSRSMRLAFSFFIKEVANATLLALRLKVAIKITESALNTGTNGGKKFWHSAWRQQTRLYLLWTYSLSTPVCKSESC